MLPRLPEGELSLKRHAVAAQGEVIREALKRAGGNRRRAAALLGISVRSLFYKLKALGLPER
jgi:two-component system response regulator AtoC